MEYLIEGYPTEGDSGFKGGNVNDLVYSIISPMLSSSIHMTGRKSIQLWREKEVVSPNELVIVDLVSVTEEKFVLTIVEARRSSLG